MQEGSVIREHRKLGPDVWSYRWWESGPNGNRVHRRIVLGTAEQLRDLSSARQMTTGLIREILVWAFGLKLTRRGSTGLCETVSGRPFVQQTVQTISDLKQKIGIARKSDREKVNTALDDAQRRLELLQAVSQTVNDLIEFVGGVETGQTDGENLDSTIKDLENSLPDLTNSRRSSVSP
jgi:hypothetical protein